MHRVEVNDDELSAFVCGG